MSTLCPYSITKGDDGLSVKVEWDVHYLTDEQIEIVRKYIAETEAENEKLRELVRIAGTYCVNGYCDPDDGCPLLVDGKCQLTDRMRELGVEV